MECPWGFGDLIHRVTGESITFRLTTKYMEPIIYVRNFDAFVKPTSRWEPAGRLVELHRPFAYTIGFAIDDLVAVHYLTPIHDDGRSCDPDDWPEGHRLDYRIAQRYAPHVLQFCKCWEDTDRRLWLAALIGDWLLAYELAQNTGDADLIAFTGERATECQRLRYQVLELAFPSRTWNGGRSIEPQCLQSPAPGAPHPILHPRKLPRGRSSLAPNVHQLNLAEPEKQDLMSWRRGLYDWAVRSGAINNVPSWADWGYLAALAQRLRDDAIRCNNEALPKDGNVDPTRVAMPPASVMSELPPLPYERKARPTDGQSLEGEI